MLFREIIVIVLFLTNKLLDFILNFFPLGDYLVELLPFLDFPESSIYEEDSKKYFYDT